MTMLGKWFALSALAAALAVGGTAQGGSLKPSDTVSAAQDFSTKGKGHAKGHAKFKVASVKSRGAKSYGFCPPGQAKKPGLGSAHRC